MAPSNFLALNPEAQQLALKTQGQSLATGMQQLLGDAGKGMSQTDENHSRSGAMSPPPKARWCSRTNCSS